MFRYQCLHGELSADPQFVWYADDRAHAAGDAGLAQNQLLSRNPGCGGPSWLPVRSAAVFLIFTSKRQALLLGLRKTTSQPAWCRLTAWFLNKRGKVTNMGRVSRRDYLKLLGTGAAVAVTGNQSIFAAGEVLSQTAQLSKPAPESAEIIADRERRMKWWHEAKFGMFIHWGLYSILARHEWVMEMEGIPATEYQ